MQITRQADYAIRAVLYLAELAAGSRASTAQIASAQQIPLTFLAKIVSQLAALGVVRATRGALPKVIWPRVGNSSTHLIDVALRARFGEVLKFDADRVSSLRHARWQIPAT